MNKVNLSLVNNERDNFLLIKTKLEEKGFKINENQLFGIDDIIHKTNLKDDFYNTVIIWLEDFLRTQVQYEEFMAECNRIMENGDYEFTFVLSKDTLAKYYEIFENYHMSNIYAYAKNETFNYDKLVDIINGKYKSPHSWKKEYLPSINKYNRENVKVERGVNSNVNVLDSFKEEPKKDIKKKDNINLFNLLDDLQLDKDIVAEDKDNVVDNKVTDVEKAISKENNSDDSIKTVDEVFEEVKEEETLSEAEIADRDKIGEDLSDEELLKFKGRLSYAAFTRKITLEKSIRAAKKLEKEAKIAESNKQKQQNTQKTTQSREEGYKNSKKTKVKVNTQNVTKQPTKPSVKKEEVVSMNRGHINNGRKNGEVNIHLFSLDNFKGKQVNDVILKGIISQSTGSKNTVYLLLDGGFVQSTSMANLDMLDAMITSSGSELDNLIEQSVIKTGFGFDSLSRVKEKSGTIANIHMILESLREKYDIVHVIGSFDTASNITLGKKDIVAKLYLNSDSGIEEVQGVTEKARNKLQSNLFTAISNIEALK